MLYTKKCVANFDYYLHGKKLVQMCNKDAKK